MQDEDLVKIFELDQETLMLLEGVHLSVEKSIDKLHEYKIERNEKIPYSHLVSTFVFHLCCFLQKKGLTANQIKSLIAGIADISSLYMNRSDKDPDPTLH